jgi:ATP-binding cassette subfamily B protein
VEQGGSNFSGGQKQRLCIARAILKKPKVVVFDDSTSAVDTKTDQKIREALAAYAPETTKIVISQRIASVENADRIFILDKGTFADSWNPYGAVGSQTRCSVAVTDAESGGRHARP